MTAVTALLLVASVALSTFSQVLLKIGMSALTMRAALGGGQWGQIALAIATSPWVVGGLTSFALSAAVWLFVLSRLDVSQAYPCVALGFALTVAAGHFLLGEPISQLRLCGTALIIAGVTMVATS